MPAVDVIHSRQYREMRADLKAIWQPQNRPCGICGQATIDWDGAANAPNSFELHHPLSRKRFPHLALDPSNAVPSHCRCNRTIGESAGPAALGDSDEDW